MSAELHDLVGIGIGPFNLSLAALAAPHGLSCLFLDESPEFSWHPGMMLEGATLQVPFLGDLVSLVDPTSRYGYLAWLRDQGRLFGFYFGEAWHVPRAEYDAYCRDVAAQLPSCRFGSRVTAVRHAVLADGRDGFAVCFDEASGPRTVLAANVVLGIGTEPVIPGALRALCAEGGALIAHSAHYLNRSDWIQAADDVTVLGSGQSGAEIVLDLLRAWHLPGRRLRWLTRSTAFEPMEYSKIGLEHFTPDYTDYFHALPEQARDRLLAVQGRLYKAVSADTLGEIRAELDRRAFPDGPASTGVTLLPGMDAVGGRVVEGPRGEALDLEFVHERSRTGCTVRTERLVLATGYAPRPARLLGPIDALVRRDGRGRPVIDRDHRVALAGTSAGLYVQNAELHTHGVGAPDLGLGAYRAATVLNAVAGRPLYPLPARTAHTSFSPAAAARTDRAITPVPAPPPAPEAWEPTEQPGPAEPPQQGRARHAHRAGPRRTPDSRQIPSQPEDRSERRTSTAPFRSPGGPLGRAGAGAGADGPGPGGGAAADPGSDPAPGPGSGAAGPDAGAEGGYDGGADVGYDAAVGSGHDVGLVPEAGAGSGVSLGVIPGAGPGFVPGIVPGAGPGVGPGFEQDAAVPDASAGGRAPVRGTAPTPVGPNPGAVGPAAAPAPEIGGVAPAPVDPRPDLPAGPGATSGAAAGPGLAADPGAATAPSPGAAPIPRDAGLRSDPATALGPALDPDGTGAASGTAQGTDGAPAAAPELG